MPQGNENPSESKSETPQKAPVRSKKDRMFTCNLCPRQCGVRRGDEAPSQGKGFCRMGEQPVIARAALHFDEEPCISGSRGSGAVFFSGCTLRCVYCQNDMISRGCFGKPTDAKGLRRIFDRLVQEDEAHNINLVTGTHFVNAILEALADPLPVPVVWNSSGFETIDTLHRLEGHVQVYLPDLKYVDPEGASRFSRASVYPVCAEKALLEMRRQVGENQFDEEGVMTRGLLIRHLILPGRVQQSKDVLSWIHDHLPEGTWVSLMAQYIPCGLAKDMPELNRTVSKEEYDEVVDHLFSLGMEDGYVQELASASASYIPPFDLTGVE